MEAAGLLIFARLYDIKPQNAAIFPVKTYDIRYLDLFLIKRVLYPHVHFTGDTPKLRTNNNTLVSCF